MDNYPHILEKERSLDPGDWDGMKRLALSMVEDMFEYLRNIRDRPVWQKLPEAIKTGFKKPLPRQPQEVEDIYGEFKEMILPYSKGNVHPRFWGWAIGTGSPFGMLAEMLAAAINPDICMGGHAPMYVEEQVIEWMKEVMGFPAGASGVLVSGASMANLTALIVARDAFLSRTAEVKDGGAARLVLYASQETHSCIKKAVDVMGLDRGALRMIETDGAFQINIDLLEQTIREDIKNGYHPFCIVANAGTVNTGAIDALESIYGLCQKYRLWMHVDGALGAFSILIPELKEKFAYLPYADSVAFDLHKWMSMPISVGCVLVRDGHLHRNSFSIQSNYLVNSAEAITDGPDPTYNYGIEMTKPFRALKVWMCLKEHGIDRYMSIFRQNVAQALFLGALIRAEASLELMCPVTLNVVCFRYAGTQKEEKTLNRLNSHILSEMQLSGVAVVSHTLLGGRYVLRAALINHRSTKEDFVLLIRTVVAIGNKLTKTLTDET
ncbi:MAG TPA: pyridoxal-dependent decarboxylase [Puia sp.]|nr:pyridoxal-dependent decarboxylase [Puia sp.]